MRVYYNFTRQAKDLYELLDVSDKKYEYTIKTMLDEVMYHLLKENNVPFEKQAEFLQVMFYDCPRAINEYKNKRF